MTYTVTVRRKRLELMMKWLDLRTKPRRRNFPICEILGDNRLMNRRCMRKTKKKLWDSFLRARITLQPALSAANRLPHAEAAAAYYASEDVQGAATGAATECLRLMGTIMELTEVLRDQSKDFRKASKSVKWKRDAPLDIDTLQRLSGSDDDASDSDINVVSRKRQKLEHISDDAWRQNKLLTESLRPFRDVTITHWNNVTQVASGAIPSKTLQRLNRPIVEQIKTICADSEYKRRRIHLKRSSYEVIGETTHNETTDPEVEKPSNGDVIDEEIYDDMDLYAMLLKELVASADEASGKHSQQLKDVKKMRRVAADSKKSKGRKLSYKVLEQLVGFMAPEPCGAEEQDLSQFKRLFRA
eukprot:Rmarinus@m.18359